MSVESAGVIVYPFAPEMARAVGRRVFVEEHEVAVLVSKIGSFASFGITRAVRVRIVWDSPIREAVVRPLNAGIAVTVSGHELCLTLDVPRNLSIEINGDLANPLFLFANPVRSDIPARGAPGVRYFEAGHIHDAGEIVLHSGETLYLEGGAVVRATVRAVDAHNIAIRGPGILDGGARQKKTNFVVLRECVGAHLEDFLMLDSFGWTLHLSASRDVRVHNCRVLGWRPNCDGVDIEYSSDITLDHCFFRTSDDCVAIKALYPHGTTLATLDQMTNPESIGGQIIPSPGGELAQIRNISITRCVFWNDLPGNAMEVGFELRADVLRGISVCDCDIIHVLRGAAISIHNADRAMIEDVLFEDIRVEDARDELVDFYVGVSIYSEGCPPEYCRWRPDRIPLPAVHRDPESNDNEAQWYIPAESDAPAFAARRGRIRNVTLRDIQVLGERLPTSLIKGYDAAHTVSNVIIENLVIHGRPASTPEAAQLRMKFATNVRFLHEDRHL